MPRVPYVSREQLSTRVQKIYDEIAGSRKGVPNPFKALLNNPEAAHQIGALGAYVRFETDLSRDTSELVILTVSRVLNSQYEWSYHEPLARQAGADEAIIEGIRREKLPGGESEQAIAMQYAYELVKERRVTDQTFKAALDTFEMKGLIELTTLVGYYIMLAYILSALEINLEDNLPPFLPIN